MRKKLILSLLAAVVLSTGTVFSGSVKAAPASTDVTGVVTESFVAVAGASVKATCNGNVETDTTDAYGSYLVHFTSAQCPFGSTVKVTAKKGGHTGTQTGTVQGITTKLNLAIVNVAIPEYGVVGAFLAGGTGIGLIALTRRKQNQAQM